MTTSRYHEIIKTLLARLIEMWAVERNVSLTGYGAATFRKRAKERGLEPDECYVLDQPVFDHEPEEHELPDVPDIAIEVVHTHVVDKMDVYAGLGVREVWIWRDNRLIVHDLANEAYVARETSALLPDLDLVQLASFVRVGPNQTELVRSYRDALRAADR